MASDDVAPLLREMEAESKNRDLGGFSKTVAKALELRVIHELADHPAFWEAVNRLMDSVRVEHDEAVLLSLGELGRLSASLKAKAEPVARFSATLLQKRVPAHFSFGDGDQRHYAAVAWERSGYAFVPEVAARTALLEDTSDKARRTWLRRLIHECGVVGALRMLTAAISDLRWLLFPGTTRSFDSSKERSRRIALLIKALRAELNADEIEVDDGVVDALSGFVRAAFTNVSRPEGYTIAAKPVEEFTLLLLHVIRMKFRLLTDPAVYATAVETRRWLPDGGWRLITRKSQVLPRLRRTLIEGLVLLLKQGKVSRELAEVHEKLSPTSQDARKELAAVAAEERDLAPDMRSWLETGEYASKNDDMGFSESDDNAVAVALLAASDFPDFAALGLPDTVGERSVRSEVIERIRDMSMRSAELRSHIQSIAKRRGLSIFGKIDEEVDFSPHAHRTVGEAGALRVRIIRPGVEAHSRRGSRIIVRAIVE